MDSQAIISRMTRMGLKQVKCKSGTYNVESIPELDHHRLSEVHSELVKRENRHKVSRKEVK